ncbi:multidrug resistance efflux transporter [Clostridium aceticum]|uniref:Multidrug resistance efflux transporter n=1 Tax=Clostridium aceticum TaxID=84022 RepID=A0A0D8IAT0_9CLOT|nr:membrane protein [Clostridium aceticum]AKL96466.1 multidrug resistance efflux transporter [Clostridium aceticum]KJF27358.1 membrane protein [Clostridium aceticum]
MKEATSVANASAIAAKKKLSSQFFKKGIIIGLLSGLTYGMFSAFLTLGMSKGVWADWYGDNTGGLSTFVIIFIVGALGSAVNDICSAIWALFNVGLKGKLGDFFRTINTTPGRMIMLAALLGGPIANVSYVVGIQLAGSMAIPITALCPAIGAILGRVLYKQELNKRMTLGIIICVSASVMIGSVGIGGEAADSVVLGLIIAFVAALGWGFEGVIAGYGSAMIDTEIGITIRQVTSGLANLLILLPILGMVEGDMMLSFKLAGEAFTSGPAMIWFAVSGFVAFISFMWWYKANSMTGAALGMATNGTYSFFGPLSCWLLLGVIGGMEGWSLSVIEWAAAIMMALGILVIAMNPMDLFGKKEEIANEAA